MIRVPASRSLGKHQAKKPCVIGNMHVWFYLKKLLDSYVIPKKIDINTQSRK
jgi:hypothetical protein